MGSSCNPRVAGVKLEQRHNEKKMVKQTTPAVIHATATKPKIRQKFRLSRRPISKQLAIHFRLTF
jgi:hypothetical protein